MQNYIGQQIDRYRVTERLGMGGMAVVYKAYDTRLERDVAIKLIRTDEIPPSQLSKLMKRFEREAKAQASFNHRHIIPVHDYGEVDGSPYLVMAYVPGGTLKEKTGQPVDYRQAIRWLIPIAEALGYAHKRGVVHRDIKPSNILFDEEGQPVLTDFGIAKILETDEVTLTGTGLGVGTPEYMAPEQWQGQAGPATDQYALGVVLYELVTGQKPYSADTPAAIILMQATEPLRAPSQIISHIPEEVENVLYKALATYPQDRYENMESFTGEISKPVTNNIFQNKNSADTEEKEIIIASQEIEFDDELTIDKLNSNIDGVKLKQENQPSSSGREKLKNSFGRRWIRFFAGLLIIGLVIGVILLVNHFHGFSFLQLTKTIADNQGLAIKTEGLVENIGSEHNITKTMLPALEVAGTKTKTPQPTSTTKIDPYSRLQTQYPEMKSHLEKIDSIISFYFNEPHIKEVDDFSFSSGWHMNAGKIANGVLSINGNNWNAVGRKNLFSEKEGFIIDFSFEKNTDFEVLFQNGDFYTDPYRRLGIYCLSGAIETNRFIGKNILGFEPIQKDVRLLPDTWYTLLMAVDENGDLLVVIWDSELENSLINQFQSGGQDWLNYAWDLSLGANIGKVSFDNYIKFSFDGIK